MKTQEKKQSLWSMGWIVVCAALWGCGGGDRPCASVDDCLAGEICKIGFCDTLSASDEGNTEQSRIEAHGAEGDKDREGGAENTQDAGEDGGSKEAEASTEAITESIIPEYIPAPCEGLKPPSCRISGPCRDVKVICEAGAWRCVYPQGFEEKEVTCDGVDNDCNGQIDEGIDRPCYEGPAGTQDVGTCKAGTQRCENGQWGVCVGQVLPKQAPQDPTAEATCDGKDDDCDGMIDDGVKRICYTGPEGTAGAGVCRYGEQRCDNGVWGKCEGEILPQVESCDGKDNNCDGQIDEGLVKRCYTGPMGTASVGVCKEGTQTCEAGQWGSCVGQVLPQSEICNGQDDDCNGQIDDGVKRACYTGAAGTEGKGICKGGVQVCSAGQWGTCVGEVLPQVESCNGIDDDCDGSVDEELVQACYTGPMGTAGVGVCKTGKSTCTAGQWGVCVGQALPQTEICNGQDDDCDGSVDEGLTRACYTGPVGTEGKGICKGGVQMCLAGQWGVCTGQTHPQAESCNSTDDNCDGMVDNGSLCGAQKICVSGGCVCDTSRGYYPFNGGCIKDGEFCPTALVQAGQVCLDADRLALCDPRGRVGILRCGATYGTSCINYGGYQGCKAPSNMDSSTGHYCMEFTPDYDPNARWQSVVGAVGVKGNAVIVFSHCTGTEVTGCGTYVTSFGHQAVCLCGDRALSCSGQTMYDFRYVSGGSCRWNKGTSFGCPDPLSFKSACYKGSVGQFPYYSCP